jgi:signal transduction histidine kinase
MGFGPHPPGARPTPPPAKDTFARRILGSVALGLLVALANFALDRALDRMGIERATTVVNDIAIGAAAAMLAFIFVSRQAARAAAALAEEARLQAALADERKRIALELHDSVGQAHAAAVLHLECARDVLAPDAPAHDGVRRALQLVRSSSTEMRCALWDLYPEELQKVSLTGAIESMANDLVAGAGLNVRCSFDGPVRRLPADAEKGLLRIIQEALSNVLKHARAREVRIELRFEPRQARLTVKDDGLGFEADRHAGSFGLTSMRNRARALGGDWTISSGPGRGTEVSASIPIPPAAG